MNEHNLPWSIDEYGTVVEPNGLTTVQAQGFALSGNKHAVCNAEFIVRAVNSHDALVASLKETVAEALSWMESCTGCGPDNVMGTEWYGRAVAALAEAEKP